MTPDRKPPFNVQVLQRWIGELAREQGIAPGRGACTEVPADGRDNDRFRDLIDLLLLEELVDDDEWPAVREACEEIFLLRAKHPWPPTVTVFDTWPDPYRALAGELASPLAEVQEAVEAVQTMIGQHRWSWEPTRANRDVVRWCCLDSLDMKEARFKALDVVEIGDHPTLAAQGQSSQQGGMTQIPAAGRLAQSTRVSADGDVLGETRYTILDEIERYL